MQAGEKWIILGKLKRTVKSRYLPYIPHKFAPQGPNRFFNTHQWPLLFSWKQLLPFGRYALPSCWRWALVCMEGQVCVTPEFASTCIRADEDNTGLLSEITATLLTNGPRFGIWINWMDAGVVCLVVDGTIDHFIIYSTATSKYIFPVFISGRSPANEVEKVWNNPWTDWSRMLLALKSCQRI